jgi:hypothetical protein
LHDVALEQDGTINDFKAQAGTLEEAEMIFYADNPGAGISKEAKAEMLNKWHEAKARLVASTLATQAIFDDIEEHCPGKTPDADCNYPSNWA